MRKFSSVLLAGAVALSTLATVAYAENPMVGGAAMFADKNIVENAVNSKDHTTLVAAVKAAGLVETLQGAGPFTVLAPVNAAFDALPAGTVDTLLKPENKDQLVKILTCHVIGAKAMSADITKMVDATMAACTRSKTVGGCELTAQVGRRQGHRDRRERQRRQRDDRRCRPVERRHPRHRQGPAAEDVSRLDRWSAIARKRRATLSLIALRQVARVSWPFRSPRNFGAFNRK